MQLRDYELTVQPALLSSILSVGRLVLEVGNDDLILTVDVLDLS